MEVLIVPDADAAGRLVADVLASHLGDEAVLGLATGSSPLPDYRELIRRHRDEGLSFAAPHP